MSAGQRGASSSSSSFLNPTLSGASHADKSAVVATSVNLSASPDLTALTLAAGRNLQIYPKRAVNFSPGVTPWCITINIQNHGTIDV